MLGDVCREILTQNKKTKITTRKLQELYSSKRAQMNYFPRDPQDAGGTTIYITPTKRRSRYYVLDDEELDSTGMEEEYYFRRYLP